LSRRPARLTNLLQLALAWCAKNPRVSTVITGATRVEQVQENMKALAVLPKLTQEVMARIDDALSVAAEAKAAGAAKA
jgi:aryl-alcohol dehydrogenase-like predicted oxidoreductase